MNFDASAVAMLRVILDDLLVSEAFTRQGQLSAVDLAQCILKLASKGERNSRAIKDHVQNLLLARFAALSFPKILLLTSL